MTATTKRSELKVVEGPLKGKVYSLDSTFTSVGQGAGVTVALQGDSRVSKVHIEIRAVKGKYVLFNRSESGTLVNGVLVEERQLEDKDRIKIGGSYVLEFRDEKAGKDSKPSLFRSPIVLGVLGVYAIAMVVLFIVLSGSTLGTPGIDSHHITQVVQADKEYSATAHYSREEQTARVRTTESYLRAGLIAERQDNYTEARRIYLALLDATTDNHSPVYQFALERLRTIPLPQKQ